MELRLLKKSRVKELILLLSGEFETYCPVEDEWHEVSLAKVPAQENKEFIEKLAFDYDSFLTSPKTIGFPQLAPMLEFKGGQIKEFTVPQKPRLIMGVRACDWRAICFVDDFFQKNYQDIYYLNKMADKIVIIIGCKQAASNCFCTSTHTGPYLEQHFDLQMVDIDDAYLVEVDSKKGAKLVSLYKSFFEQPKEKDIKAAQKTKQKAIQSVKLKLDFEKAIDAFCNDNVPENIFKKIAERCIHCGGCLYICPTCTCYNVFDQGGEKYAVRYRNWDACVFSGYTREASGHNPRQAKWLRAARRYEHKLKYDYQTTGVSGCVGCGRCLTVCPVGIGISQVIDEVSRI